MLLEMLKYLPSNTISSHYIFCNSLLPSFTTSCSSISDTCSAAPLLPSSTFCSWSGTATGLRKQHQLFLLYTCGCSIVDPALIIFLVTFRNTCCSGVVPVLTKASQAPMANPNAPGSAQPVRPWDQQPAYLAAINRQLAPGQPAQYGKTQHIQSCHSFQIVLTVIAVPRRQGRTPDDVTDFIAG